MAGAVRPRSPGRYSCLLQHRSPCKSWCRCAFPIGRGPRAQVYIVRVGEGGQSSSHGLDTAPAHDFDLGMVMLRAAQIDVPGREILLNHELVEPDFGSQVVRYGWGAGHGLNDGRIGRFGLDLVDNSLHDIERLVLVFSGGCKIGLGVLLTLVANPSCEARAKAPVSVRLY